MKISLAQINPIIGNYKHQEKSFKTAISKAIETNTDLLIFPELSLTGYPAKDLLLDNTFIKNQEILIQKIIKISAQTKNLGILFGAVLIQNNQLYNSAYLIYEGNCLFVTSKTLLPNDDVFDEKRYFEANTTSETVIFKEHKLAITICEDLWVKNIDLSPIHQLMKQSPTIVINLSASPFYLNKAKNRYNRAKEIVRLYKVPVIVVNQVGAQDELIFDGNSFILDKNGDCLLQCESFKETQQTVSLTSKRIKDFNYQPVNKQLLEALLLGISDYFKKTGFQKAVIGLSGGIDSAVCYVLACKALGSKNVIPVMMPTAYTSSESIRDAQKMASFQKTKLVQLPITDLYESSILCLSKVLNMTEMSLTHENIQARLRAMLLMAFANHKNALVLSTGNKSELAMGYSTLYGDMAGALSIIGDVLKSQVFNLAKYLNTLTPGCIPQYVITRAPSAELKPNQTDQDSLPEYEIIDSFIDLHISSPYKVTTKSKDLSNRLNNNEHKRNQSAIILKVSQKAFGTGRRFPVAAHYS